MAGIMAKPIPMPRITMAVAISTYGVVRSMKRNGMVAEHQDDARRTATSARPRAGGWPRPNDSSRSAEPSACGMSRRPVRMAS